VKFSQKEIRGGNDEFYRGMLKWKYNLNPSDFFDVRIGIYRDF
jgi:hypothetical protein